MLEDPGLEEDDTLPFAPLSRSAAGGAEVRFLNVLLVVSLRASLWGLGFRLEGFRVSGVAQEGFDVMFREVLARWDWRLLLPAF